MHGIPLAKSYKLTNFCKNKLNGSHFQAVLRALKNRSTAEVEDRRAPSSASTDGAKESES